MIVNGELSCLRVAGLIPGRILALEERFLIYPIQEITYADDSQQTGVREAGRRKP